MTIPADVPNINFTDDQADEWIIDHYPSYSPFMDIPDIRDVMRQAAREGWDANILLSHLQDTGWWKTTSDTARNWVALTFTDPATAAQRRTQSIYDIQTMTSAAGLQLGLDDLSSLAELKNRYGWDDITLRRQALAMFQAKGGPTNFASDIGSTVERIKSQAAQYLFRISDSTANDLAQKWFLGEISDQGITAYMQGAGKMAHPFWSDDIDRGITPLQMMQPALQTVASTLEISPDQIDLLEPKWSAILDYTDPTSNKIRPMTSAESANWARNQTDYRYTKGANDQAADLAKTLAQGLGMAKF